MQILVAGDDMSGYSRRWLLCALADLRTAEYIVALKRYYQRKGPDGIVRHVPRQEFAFTLAPDGARALTPFVHPEPMLEAIRRWEDRKDIEHELGVAEFACSAILALRKQEDLRLTGLWNGSEVERLFHEYCALNKIGSPPRLRPDLGIKLSSSRHSSDFALVVEWSTGSQPLSRRAGQGASSSSSEESKLKRATSLVIDQRTRQGLEAILRARHVWFLTVAPDANRARRTLDLFRDRVFVPRPLRRKIYRKFLAMESASVTTEKVLGDVCYRYEYDPTRCWGEAVRGYSILDLIKGRFKKLKNNYKQLNQ